MKLLVTFAFCSKDVQRLLDLLLWVSQLGHSWHPCLLVADPDVSIADGLKVLDLAGKSFEAVEMVTLEKHVDGWIPGSNALFMEAATQAQARNLPFLFIEPDAVPLKEGWVETLAQAYETCGKPFMGSLVSHQQAGLPSPYFEGVGIYPADTSRQIGCKPMARSWTYDTAGIVVPQALNSPLFHHLWGEAKQPPTFAERNVPGTNIFCVRQLKPEAVLYHRCKDGSLIRLLRRAKGIVPAIKPCMVLPFCNREVPMFIKNLQWQQQLGETYDCEAVLSYDRGTQQSLYANMANACAKLFTSVSHCVYDIPRPGQWPPTIAFVAAARHMASKRVHPWLWFEYDMIPLKKGWFKVLWDEYQSMGKPFMGPIVHGMGHMNGTGFYPANTPAYIPKAMQNLKLAWDVAMKPEMMNEVHNCAHLLQHVWIVDAIGRFQPHGSGALPSFRNKQLLAQLQPSSVAFHRCKDGSLIDRLRELL